MGPSTLSHTPVRETDTKMHTEIQWGGEGRGNLGREGGGIGVGVGVAKEEVCPGR